MMLAALALWLLPTSLAGPGTFPIVNGEEEDEFPSAVAIGTSEDTPFLGRMSTCSASLITPRILLTAAHCSEELGAQFGLSPEAFRPLFRDNGAALIGQDVSDDDTLEVRFAEVLPHPDYDGVSGFTGTPSHDLELIILTEDAPRPATWFATEIDDDEIIDAVVTSVGYGVTNGQSQQGSGIKRSAKLTISRILGEFLVSETDENREEANVCSGDSGGPQYRKSPDGRWLQVSVHSWADQFCTQMSGSTRTDLDVDWILDGVKDVHGTRDFCEASGLYGDGACDAFCDDIDPDCLADEEGEAGGCACDGSGGLPISALLPLTLLALRRRRR